MYKMYIVFFVIKTNLKDTKNKILEVIDFFIELVRF